MQLFTAAAPLPRPVVPAQAQRRLGHHGVVPLGTADQQEARAQPDDVEDVFMADGVALRQLPPQLLQLHGPPAAAQDSGSDQNHSAVPGHVDCLSSARVRRSTENRVTNTRPLPDCHNKSTAPVRRDR